MKNFKLKSILTALFLTGVVFAYAQQPALQYFRANDKDGLNVFET
jgi:hypothetical protein